MTTELTNPVNIVSTSIGNVMAWVENHGYKGYDPGDGSLSFLRHLTCDSQFLSRLLTAAVLRSPFEVRPWIGIRPHTSTKGMGYMGWGYVRMYAFTKEEKYRNLADNCFEWLMANYSVGYEGYCWGNHFAFTTRAGTIAQHTPTIVWSSLIGLAFLEAYETTGAPDYLRVAASTCEFIKALPREVTGCGTCISYVPHKQSSIHNSNMLGAALLARVATHTKDPESIQLAQEAMLYSCSRQHANGAWFYGEESRYHWIDSFHTGYNLDCLKRYITSSGDRSLVPNLEKGLEFFQNSFFEKNGCPKYYNDKRYPIDIQCAAQAIDTLTYLWDRNPRSLELAQQVALWTIANMQAADGHFYYRDLGWKKVKTPMLHWGQATTFKALAHLLGKIAKAEATEDGGRILASQSCN